MRTVPRREPIDVLSLAEFLRFSSFDRSASDLTTHLELGADPIKTHSLSEQLLDLQEAGATPRDVLGSVACGVGLLAVELDEAEAHKLSGRASWSVATRPATSRRSELTFFSSHRFLELLICFDNAQGQGVDLAQVHAAAEVVSGVAKDLNVPLSFMLFPTANPVQIERQDGLVLPGWRRAHGRSMRASIAVAGTSRVLRHDVVRAILKKFRSSSVRGELFVGASPWLSQSHRWVPVSRLPTVGAIAGRSVPEFREPSTLTNPDMVTPVFLVGPSRVGTTACALKVARSSGATVVGLSVGLVSSANSVAAIGMLLRSTRPLPAGASVSISTEGTGGGDAFAKLLCDVVPPTLQEEDLQLLRDFKCVSFDPLPVEPSADPARRSLWIGIRLPLTIRTVDVVDPVVRVMEDEIDGYELHPQTDYLAVRRDGLKDELHVRMKVSCDLPHADAQSLQQEAGQICAAFESTLEQHLKDKLHGGRAVEVEVVWRERWLGRSSTTPSPVI